MNRKKQCPPVATGGQGIVQHCGENNSDNSEHIIHLQAYRATYLARRHRLAPAFAAAVAGLAFTVEATK